MDQENIEIETKQGRLRGLVKKTAGANKVYYSFQGIPYAKPPLGKLRFKAPEPFGKWDGVRDALKEGNDSLQMHMLFKNLVGDEDCLYLNVYTTQTGSAAKKSVMVWIHGGGFAGGSGSSELYGPDYLIDHDIVVVTINYRCGVLGFLSLENERLPGNNGMKDQVLALRWVQENIASYGGDPGNVTIFGESAGGASVNYHLLSPLSRGLFHKAIMQSGYSVCQWAFQTCAKEKAIMFAKELGCSSEDPDDILDFLMSVPAADLVHTQSKESLATSKEQIQKFSLQFAPCVEKTGTPFLPDSPLNLMERGEYAKVPVMMGVTDKEGLLALILKELRFEKVNEDLSLLIPMDLSVKHGKEEERNLGKEILKFYTNQDILTWEKEVVLGYVDFVTDVAFAIGHEKARQCFLKHSNCPVYCYQFTYVSPRALSTPMLSMAYPDQAGQFVGTGASHGDELVHLFKSNMSQLPFVPPTGEDQRFMNKILKAWTNFAKNGNPNGTELGAVWEQDSIQRPSYMELGDVWKAVGSICFQKRTEFWKKIYEKCS